MVLGAVGVALGFPLADPIVITIIGIVWQSAGAVLTHMLDGVEPGTIGEIAHAAEHMEGIDKVTDVRARWLGHRLDDLTTHLELPKLMLSSTQQLLWR